MKNKLIFAAVLFSLAMIIVSGGFYFSLKGIDTEDEKSEYIVSLNEIQKLNESGEYDTANEKIALLQEDIRKEETKTREIRSIPILCGIGVLFIALSYGYVYFALLNPFDKMKKFASEISAGNFDLPLKYERSNYFGEFTWAFDSMRTEITKARRGETLAIENNKTVIASLSHDIKTPIASIRAYAEGLSANMDTTFEKREKYLSVIIKKCDEVSRLTDDLFLHSLSDLDKLKISPEKTELSEFLERTLNEIGAERNDIVFQKSDFTAYINADRNRLIQLCENVISNARKYAKTNIDVFVTKDNDNIILHFRDYGSGIPDEDMPFIFDKFYRGNNCGNEQGSGLGLFIVKYIAEKSGGNVLLQNHEKGLEVKIILPHTTS
ncbi:MAG: HAMP domain-containing histidine kinase [Ruminococcaceae bacterium]|nr:HAMP domain-containing histidine kinase [Oscillospiraceae bacterium]